MKPLDGLYGANSFRSGAPEDKTRCVEEVWNGARMTSSQCSRKRGHGPDGEWCKQHGKRAQRAREAAAERAAKEQR